MAVYVVKGTQGQAPALVAIRTVGEQPEIAKENIHVGSVRDGRWRCWSVRLLEKLFTIARRHATPSHCAAGAVEADGEQRLALNRGNEDMVGGEDLCGVPRRQRGPP